jgi:hypothetical protein
MTTCITSERNTTHPHDTEHMVVTSCERHKHMVVIDASVQRRLSTTVSPLADDWISWNSTPTSSLGAASPLDGNMLSQRHSAISQCGNDVCVAAGSVDASVHDGGATSRRDFNDIDVAGRDAHDGAVPPDLCATLPPSPTGSPTKRTTVEAHEHGGVLMAGSVRSIRSGTDGASSLSSDEDDEVVGVTADGELLFRKRDGTHGFHQRRGDSASAPAMTTFRPTPHRTQPRPQVLTPSTSAVDPRSTDVSVTAPETVDEVRQLFGDAPSSAESAPPMSAMSAATPSSLRAPHDATVVRRGQAGAFVELSMEDIRFAQLALRLRDRENDVYSHSAHEDFFRLCAAREERERHEWNERFRHTAWDLRRF